MAKYLKKSQPEMRGSFALRGGFSMMSKSGGLKPSAVAGRPSVTKLTQSSWTGIRASGKPSAAVRKMLMAKKWLQLQNTSLHIRTVCATIILLQNPPNNLPHIGGDKISDELLHVIVNSSAFFNGSHDGREVVIGEDHLRGWFGDSGARAHGDADLRFLQGRGVIHSVTCL